MKITEILATRSELHFRVDAGEKSLKLVERVPVVGGDKGRILEETRCEVKGGIASIPRFSDKHDRLASRFELFAGGEKLEVISNAAWKAPSGTLSAMFQAGALIELSGDVKTAFEIYYDNYDIHELPPLK